MRGVKGTGKSSRGGQVATKPAANNPDPAIERGKLPENSNPPSYPKGKLYVVMNDRGMILSLTVGPGGFIPRWIIDGVHAFAFRDEYVAKAWAEFCGGKVIAYI